MTATLVTTFPPLRRRLAGAGGLVFYSCIGIVAITAVIAVIGPWIAPYDPNQTDVLAASKGISPAHWLGTDSLGRDIFSRALAGAQQSFAGPALIVLISGTAGTAIALFSAWQGGAIDRAITRALNVMFSVPGILVAVLTAAVLGAGFLGPVLALGIVYTPFIARVVRSVAVVERKRGYVESLQLAGASSLRIGLRHILPNLTPIILAQTTYGFGAALVDFSVISFLGLGVQRPTAEWGVMVAEGRAELLNGAMLQSGVAGSLIVVTVVAFNVLGAKIATNLEGRS